MQSDAPSVRILWITPKFPLGTPDGARHATCSLIRQLTKKNVQIDLICLVPEGEPADAAAAQEKLGVQRCSIIRRSRSKFFPIPGWQTPFTFRTFAASRVRSSLHAELRRFISSGYSSETTYAVFDGLHAFAALPIDLPTLSTQVDKIIYRAHNVETVLWEQCAERARTPFHRWFFNHQANLVRDFETLVSRRSDLIAPVSEEDARKFERMAPGVAIAVTRIGMDFPQWTDTPVTSDSASFPLLFVGRLDWLPNKAGLQWFLNKVWPTLHRMRPQAALTIAGMGDRQWLESYEKLPGITVLGQVESVEPLYESSVLSIAPLFQGSGTRVKIIEAARYRKGMITTALGAEGSGLVPGQSYFRAETEEEWVALLSKLTAADCQRAGSAAYHTMRESFDGERIAAQLLKSLQVSGVRV